MSTGNEEQLNSITIALDCMGGDFGTVETVAGAKLAAKAYDGAKNLRILLVADINEINKLVNEEDHPNLSIVQPDGKITDDEHPIEGLKRKPNSSIVVTTKLVKSGNAQAAVSMGSTGASMAASVMILGLLPGLDRPCIGGPFLGLAPNTVLMDMGSNIDCRPNLLVSFAMIGSVFAEKFLGIQHPRVGLLSVGSEPAKGNKQVQESYKLFESSPVNFVGNVEGMDFFTDRADVIVCDGFVGNILLKFAEGMGNVLRKYTQSQLSKMLPVDQAGELGESLWTETNLARSIGGPLFGVKAPVVVGHGSAKSEEIAGAISTALKLVELDVQSDLEKSLIELASHQNVSDLVE